MADESTLETKIAALVQKVEKESRFTRSLIVICTAALLGVSLVPVKIMLADLPNLMITEFIAKLEVVHSNWKVLDKLPHGGSGGSIAQ
jgi:hypothetical protein